MATNRSGVIGADLGPTAQREKLVPYSVRRIETALRDLTALAGGRVEDVAAMLARIWGL